MRVLYKRSIFFMDIINSKMDYTIYCNAKKEAFSGGSEVKNMDALYFPCKPGQNGKNRELIELNPDAILMHQWMNNQETGLSPKQYTTSFIEGGKVKWDKITNQQDFFRALVFTHANQTDGKYFFDPEYHMKCILTAEKDTKKFIGK